MDIDERWKDISRIYDAALERTGDERATFVATACGTDEALRREVESLLSCDSDVNDLLKAPAGDVMAKAIDVMAKAMAADAGSLLGRQVRYLPNRRTTRRRRDGRGLQGDRYASAPAGGAQNPPEASARPSPATAVRPGGAGGCCGAPPAHLRAARYRAGRRDRIPRDGIPRRGDAGRAPHERSARRGRGYSAAPSKSRTRSSQPIIRGSRIATSSLAMSC